MNFKERVFRKESLARYLDSDKKFSKQLGASDLITMGIGIVIGTGIFILPGTVAAMHSGPAIILSFVVAAVVCSLAAMCYAEFSSALPVSFYCDFHNLRMLLQFSVRPGGAQRPGWSVHRYQSHLPFLTLSVQHPDLKLFRVRDLSALHHL